MTNKARHWRREGSAKWKQLCILMTLALSGCQLGDNRIYGSYVAPSGGTGALSWNSTKSAIPFSSSFQLDFSGGQPPYSYSVLSGGGTIDSNGLFTADFALEEVVLEITDSMGDRIQMQLQVQPGQLNSGMNDNYSIAQEDFFGNKLGYWPTPDLNRQQ